MSETNARLGQQLAVARRQRRWTLQDVAQRTARQPARLSEIESGKGNSTIGTLETVGQAVGLSLLFVPASRLDDVLNYIGQSPAKPRPAHHPGSVYEEVFIADAPDLEDEEPPNARP